MSKTVLLATEKGFSAGAVSQAEVILTAAGHKLVKLENYTDKADLLKAAASCDAMIIRSDKADEEVINAAKALKVIVRAGAGFDNIDLAAASAKNVVAMNTPGMNANAVAELAFGMLVMHARNCYDGTSGRELRGRKLGLVGCGMVGVQMIKIAKGFGLQCFAVDPFLSEEQVRAQGAEPVADRETLFKTCDFVSLHVPCTAETKGLFGSKFLDLLPKDGVMINTARLEVVDEEGLIKSLKARPDLGYISDVQLADKAKVQQALGDRFAKQVHCTPKKMGAQTAEANNNCCGAAARQIVDFFAKGDTSCQVNRAKGAENPAVYCWAGGSVSTNAGSVLGADRKCNFGAGPCCLPLAVLKKAQADMLNWEGKAGMSVMEMSHRGAHFESIIQAARDDLRELLAVPSNFQIIFLQGGATTQFAAIPLNLLGEKGAKADYLVTGTWGEKAAQECNKWGVGNVIATGKPGKYTSIPAKADWKFSADAKYVHYTSNETVNGVEFAGTPEAPAGKLLVGDHSSNFMSRKIEWAKYACIYAGAQKNVGPAGVTIVIVREDLLGKELPECPTALSWKTYADQGSMYNTPSCYPIYMMGLYLKHVKATGGLEKYQELAEQRSKMLYDVIESSNGFYTAPVHKDCRSRMNAPFLVKGDNTELTKKFLKESEEAGLSALAGHRSVGGCRASIYNAMPVEGVAKLCSFMVKFAKDSA